MINRELVDFIKAEKSKGKSEEEIKALLIANGWNEGDFKERFNTDNINIITEEGKDEITLQIGGQIVFFIGLLLYLILIFFLWNARGDNDLGGLGGLVIALALVVYWIPVLAFLVIFLIIFVLSIIYGIKLIKRGYKLWGYLNLIFPSLFVFLIIFLILLKTIAS